MVHVREVQIKAPCDFDRQTPEDRMDTHFRQSVEHPAKCAVIEFGSRDALTEKMPHIPFLMNCYSRNNVIRPDSASKIIARATLPGLTSV